jgi:hypothetical protein
MENILDNLDVQSISIKKLNGDEITFCSGDNLKIEIKYKNKHIVGLKTNNISGSLTMESCFLQIEPYLKNETKDIYTKELITTKFTESRAGVNLNFKSVCTNGFQKDGEWFHLQQAEEVSN